MLADLLTTVTNDANNSHKRSMNKLASISYNVLNNNLNIVRAERSANKLKQKKGLKILPLKPKMLALASSR